jgi:hypothetical protein
MRRYGAAGVFLFLGVSWLVTAGVDWEVKSAVVGVLCLTTAVLHFFRVPDRAQERWKRRLEAKYGELGPIARQPDNLPLWFSPDNPPGWYRNPATEAPEYWSELGWRIADRGPQSAGDELGSLNSGAKL